MGIYQWRTAWGSSPTHRVSPWIPNTTGTANDDHQNYYHPPAPHGKGKGKGKGTKGNGQDYSEVEALRKENADLKRNANAAVPLEDGDPNGTQPNRKQEQADRSKQRAQFQDKLKSCKRCLPNIQASQ